MATVFETITELSSIVTDAITAGNDNNIPDRIIRNTLVKVSTGKYYEVLPIIVPAECCILGDELRSTNVQPRKSSNSILTPKEDFNYSYEGLKRLEDVIGDVVTGNTVTASIGNTQTQDQSWPTVDNVPQREAVEKLARNVRKRIDVGLGTKKEASLTKAYDMSVPAHGYARDLLKLNKEFLQAEVVAYLNANYPNLAYSRTKCKQDIGFLIDSVGYDLTYGGNWQSVKAGEAYYEGTNLNISTSEKSATIAVYAILRDRMITVAQDIVVNPTSQSDPDSNTTNPVSQISGQGYAGTNASGTLVQNLMNNIIDIVTNGSGTVSVTYPDTSNVAQNLVDASTILTNLVPSLQTTTIDFINSHFGSFQYNSAKCRRDLDFIITDTAYDVALGTNYNAVFQGLAYQRPVNAYNLQNERVQTVGAIRKTRDLLEITVSSDGSSATGSSTAQTRVHSAYNEIVDIINGNSASALSFPESFSGITADQKAAKLALQTNKATIQTNVLTYINSNYGVNYNSTKCSRDIGYIIDALSYDLLYGGTQAITRITESYFVDGVLVELQEFNYTGAALSSFLTAVYTELKDQAKTVVTTTTEDNVIEANMTILINALNAQSLDSVPTIVFPNLSTINVTSEFIVAASDINSDKNDVIKEVIQYISDTYNDFNYNHSKCSRDIQFLVEAASYDMMLDTNFASLQAGYSYLRSPSKKVVGDQKDATLAANEYVRTQIVSALTGQTTAINRINSSWEWIQDIIFSGSSEGGNRQTEDMEMYNAIRQLELNKEFLVDEVLFYVDNFFKDVVTQFTTSSSELTISNTNWLFPGMPIKFNDGNDVDGAVITAGLDESVTYYVLEITSDTTFTISDTKFGSLVTPLTLTQNSQFEVIKAYAYNRTLCARDVRAYIDAIKWDLVWAKQSSRSYTKYGFNVTLYLPGIYKTRLAARYYVNSVLGSQEEDMYYLRNGTGLRLQTVEGLQGDLGPANEFGTQRPTAGAYASLDPGWGPNDQRVWITARSPYVQNVTTFGYAAVGQKIDGALHNGGNDSIVSNDFTQVISDGIGAWLLNNGRAELVSVFTYYAHIGYLSESGGRIRATNGNNSYGKFGSVAEGVDADETPVTAIVDNQTQYNATVANVFTDADELLQVEYNHAGNDYTEASLRFFGVGSGEETVIDEFRDQAVNQVRIIEIDDSTGNPDAVAGGEGYLVVSNTAQAGTTTQITIAATDGNSSTAYPGMNIYLTSGQAAGQYGIIKTYNAGTKVATVKRVTDGQDGWDHVVPGSTIVSPNATTIYQIEPNITFSSPTRSDSTHTIATDTYKDVHYFETTAQYTEIVPVTQSDGIGAKFDVTRNGEKYYVSLSKSGIDDIAGSGYARLDTVTLKGSELGGEDVVNDIVITITSVGVLGEVVDYDFTGIGRKGLFVALPDAGTTGRLSIDGEDWSAITATFATNLAWNRLASGVQDDGSSTFKPSVIVATGTTGGAISVNYSTDGVTWSAPASQPNLTATSSTTDIAFGNIGIGINRFVAISPDDNRVAYSDDGGATWTVSAAVLPSTGFTNITYGQGTFVAIKPETTDVIRSTTGLSWTTETLPTDDTWCDIVYGKGRFYAINSNSVNGAYSIDGGQTWVANTIVTGNSGAALPKRIAYGQGIFAVTTDDANEIPFSEDGIVWNRTITLPSDVITWTFTPYTTTNGPDAGGYTGGLDPIAFGNPARDPKFVAIKTGATANVANLKLGCTTSARPGVANTKIFELRLIEPGSAYNAAPEMLITDPNNIYNALFTVRTNSGVLAQPTFISRGTGYITSTAEVDTEESNGNADFFQDGSFIAVRRLSETPVNGSNVVFSTLPNKTFKLVNTVSLVGLNDGSKTAFLQISPPMEIEDAIVDGDDIEMRIRFSQVRLTGHDFLDIGTGNFDDTNYPNDVFGDPVNDPTQSNETVGNNGGRVFFTATDQDGNFRVGDLFSIEQATGVATLNAEAFNIAGLQELTLGEVTLGGNSASVTEFSTDPFFTADSDSVVPTQRAIKAYIEAQIGGGGASLIVNSITAGNIFINTTQITTTTGTPITFKANVNFTKTVLGLPLAYNYFLR